MLLFSNSFCFYSCSFIVCSQFCIKQKEKKTIFVVSVFSLFCRHFQMKITCCPHNCTRGLSCLICFFAVVSISSEVEVQCMCFAFQINSTERMSFHLSNVLVILRFTNKEGEHLNVPVIQCNDFLICIVILKMLYNTCDSIQFIVEVKFTS